MKQLFSSLRMTMESGHIKDVTFVYDYCNDRNTLSRESILVLLNNKEEQCDRYSVTEEKQIALKGHVEVNHPLFEKNKKIWLGFHEGLQ